MKTKTEIDNRILAIADPVAIDMGYHIVRVRVMANKRSVVQIMAERLSDGLMGVEDCAALSRALSSTFEVEDPLVSSPGLERPLTDLKDFETYQGYLARIELDRLVEGRKRFRGVLAGVDAKLLITDALITAGQKTKLAMAEAMPDDNRN